MREMKPQEDGDNYAVRTVMFCTPCQILAHQGDHLRDLSKIMDTNNQNRFDGVKVKTHFN